MAKPIQRRLAAIAVADVAGYSRLMGADEAGTLAALNDRRKHVLDPVIRAHEGRLVKVMGDGVLVEFASACNAVQAALDLQEKMAAANHGVAEDRRIVLRIGINLGEVIVEGNDLFGDGVNIAARLESIAPVGGIVISGSAYEQVRNRIQAAFEDLGHHSLKNIAEPVHVYRVETGGAPAAVAKSGTTVKADAAAKLSIAVLPFANLGGDPEQGYFSDGVAEDIITELSRWRMLSVSSRSASFRFRGIAVDMKEVARELNVRFILEGSVRRMGDRLRITTQLIDSESGNHVWAEKFDREAADIFRVQDQVVRTIVSTLVGRVQVSDVEKSRRKPPNSLAAYEYVLKANALPWDDPDGAAEATRLLRKAIEVDPGYGFAHAVLAAMCTSRWHDDPIDCNDALDEAFALAKRAVELDESESTSFSILGQVHMLRRCFDLAIECEQRAVELNPSNQWNAADMGYVLTHLGRAEEALDWFKRAKEIDPYFDTSWYWRSIGLAHMVLEQYPQALAMFERAPGRVYRTCALMAGCHARLGDMDGAGRRAAQCLALRPDFSIDLLLTKSPFKNPADAERVAESLRVAGLPQGAEPSWAGDVLRFWFEELSERDWFAKSDVLDARIRDRFGDVHERLVAGPELQDITPRSLLATVIVLDQFSRNLFRDSARAFAADARARELAHIAVDRGWDKALANGQRMFLYLPFEHSENPDDQVLSVRLFTELGEPEWTRYARAHQAIIEQFGRFPHRNAALGRTSSEAELRLLQLPMGHF